MVANKRKATHSKTLKMTHTTRLKFQEARSTSGESSTSSTSSTSSSASSQSGPRTRSQGTETRVRGSEASPIYTFSCPPTSRVVRRQGSLESDDSAGFSPPTTRIVRHQGIAENPEQPEKDASTSTDVIETQQEDQYVVEFSPASKKKITSSEYFAKKEKDFENQLRDVKGFIIKEMKSDGACMFRAVADQVYGDQEMHKIVRENCMDYMVKNEEFFSKFVTEDFNEYIQRKRNDRTYGDHVEIQALSEIYNRPIEVYQYSLEPINTFICYYNNNTEQNPPVRLSYHGNIHYNSIVDPNNPNIGVGLGLAGYKTREEIEQELKKVSRTETEEAIIEDKLRSTDWEATDKHLAHVTAWQSYIDWVHNNSNANDPDKPGPSGSGGGKPLDPNDPEHTIPGSCTFSRHKPTSRSPPPQVIQHKPGYTISGASLSHESRPGEGSSFVTQASGDVVRDATGEWVYIPSEHEGGGRRLHEEDFMVGYGGEQDDEDQDLAFALAQSRQEYLDSLKK